MDVKDSINVSAIKQKEGNDSSSKKSQGGQPQSKSSIGAFNIQQDADRMVKK